MGGHVGQAGAFILGDIFFLSAQDYCVRPVW